MNIMNNSVTMKCMKSLSLCLTAVCLLFLGVSCSEDTEQYESKVPQFSDIVFDKDVIYTEELITAEAIQSVKGKLIDMSEYKWSSSDMPSDSTLHWSLTSVIYPDNTSNPSCTFRTPDIPGTYHLTFTGKYKTSGRSGNSATVVEINGGTVKYEYTPLCGYVTLSKRFKVVARP